MHRETQIPEWLTQGLVIVGNWEPLIFRRRVGFAHTYEEAIYAEEHGEETVRYLSELGVSLVITHFHKGFGLSAEADEIERTRLFVEAAHAYGIKVGAYIRFDALASESFSCEGHDPSNWFQVDSAGRFQTYPRQDFRRVTCPNQEAYIQYVEGLIDVAIREVGVDLIHFDGFWWGTAEPCHCDACRDAFRTYLAHKYPTKPEREGRFGHHHVERIEMPTRDAVHAWDEILNPVHQEWIRFRCDTFQRIHKRLTQAAKKHNPQIAVDVNTLVPIASNGQLRQGISLPKLAPRNDAFWTEGRNDLRLESDNRLISRIREFKYVEAAGNVCFSYVRGTSRHQIKRSFAEVLAFNFGNAGMIGSPLIRDEPFTDTMTQWVAFYRKRLRLYANTTSVAQVAVLRHETTLSLSTKVPYRSAHVIEQLLIESSIPFRHVFECHLEHLPASVKLLILPDVTCMDERQAAAIAAFVRGGGGVIITGDTSLYDLDYRKRPDFLLRDLIGPDVPQPRDSMISFHFPTVDERATRVPGIIRRHYGAGRVVYAATVKESSSLGIWGPPERSLEWLQALQWASGSLDIEIDAPREVLCEARRTSDGTQCIHLVNAAPHAWQNAVTIRVKVNSESAAPRRVIVHDPESEADQRVTPSRRSDAADVYEFIVPRLRTYALVEIDSKEQEPTER